MSMCERCDDSGTVTGWGLGPLCPACHGAVRDPAWRAAWRQRRADELAEAGWITDEPGPYYGTETL